MQALRVDQSIWRDGGQDRVAGSPRQALVKRKGRVAGIPDPPQGFDKSVAAWKVDRNEVRHGQKATVAAVNRWILGARPRTLPAAVVPVAIGAGAAVGGPSPEWWRVGPALIVSLALQVGVNYSNDYSDGIRGTDDVRVGPLRLVAGGLAKPSHVKRAALMAFGVAAVAGLILALVTTWWLILVGLVAMLAGWGYTGGPKPYGYLGLGELFVFVFFGLVATVGTTYVVVEEFPARAWAAGSAAGFLACALLVINNLRDIPTDRAAGKRTLAVRLGDSRTRWLYVGCLAAAAILIVVIAVAWRAWAAVALAGFAAAIPPVLLVRRGAEGRQLIAVLAATARTQLLVGLLLALGLALGPIST
ncbi:MAG: 1,4-dihydroxy-2-naphthoate polyprenyltransferase [Ilumatobacteraceae bacterium]|jgi:1,4-dihydroxy-2-naphthoate octaprenyltransferase